MQKEVWTELKAEEFLEKYLPVAKHTLCKKQVEVEKAAKQFGFPVVLKISAKDLVHKSDIGGVQIAKNKEELCDKYNLLISAAKKHKLKLNGIIAQEFIEGHQAIVGIKKDATFGHCVMLGSGGIYVELLKDVAFRVCPINEQDAEEMINEIKTKKIWEGYRGGIKINFNELKKTLVKISQIPIKNKKIDELDINPLILNSKVCKVVDARISWG